MESTELKVLAHKIQLEIEEGEMKIYLETFAELEKLLVNFKKVKIGKKVKPMTRINTGFLTLSDLKKIKKKYTNQRISEENLKINAEVNDDHFVLFRTPLKTQN